jgi:hypothetical protein
LKPGWLRFTYLKHFSQPAKDRPIYRLIDGGSVSSICELGLECGVRMQRMIELALSHHASQQIRYAGFDLFESRPAGLGGLTLKEAHCQLARAGIRPRLVPGEITAGILRNANMLPQTDLIVISGGIDRSALEAAWPYIPRMLHPQSVIFWETGGRQAEFQSLTYVQVCELARQSAAGRRRAA